MFAFFKKDIDIFFVKVYYANTNKCFKNRRK